jgi:hypothetical protein
VNRPRPRSDRLTTLVVLLLHFLVVAAAPVVDGATRIPAGGAGVHIEAPSESPCYPVHDDLHCQICHALGHNLLASPRVVPAFAPVAAVALAAPVAVRSHISGARTPSLGPRAPPLA